MEEKPPLLSHTIVSKPEHLDNVPEGQFIILSVSMLGKVDEAFRMFMKKLQP